VAKLSRAISICRAARFWRRNGRRCGVLWRSGVRGAACHPGFVRGAAAAPGCRDCWRAEPTARTTQISRAGALGDRAPAWRGAR
jgi:hypothetical protein